MNKPLKITRLFNAAEVFASVPSTKLSELVFTPYEVEGRKGVSLHSLYDTRAEDVEGPAAAIVRYAPGALTPRHLHPGWELLLVLEGELIDDRGRHGAGVLQIYPPGSTHELSSQQGCTFLVVWEQPVRTPTMEEREALC